MKVQCDKKELLDCVNICAKAAANKASIPALEGVLIETLNDSIQIAGYNLTTGIQSQIKAAVIKQGKIVLDAKLFNGIISKMEDDVVNISVSDNMKAAITGKKCKFNISGMSPDEFPELPVIQGKSSISIKQGLLKSMIQDTIFAVSKVETHPGLTGVLFDITESTLNLVAADGYRLAIRKEKIDITEKSGFIVPGEALNEITKILSGCDDPAEILIDEKHIMFKMGGITVITRTISGDFIDYNPAIPADSNLKTCIDKHELISAIERVSVIADNTPSPLRCLFKNGTINLSVYTATGESEDTVDLNKPCDDEIEIGFNYKYLLEALKAANEDEICIELTSNLSPCIIKSAIDDKFIYLVLPVRLRTRPEQSLS